MVNDGTETGEIIFYHYKQQRKKLITVVTYLADIIDAVQNGENVEALIKGAKRYLIIDSGLIDLYDEASHDRQES